MKKKNIDRILKENNVESIRDTDVVSGWAYRKLIEDFKAYDLRRKEYITRLENTVLELQKKVKELNKKK